MVNASCGRASGMMAALAFTAVSAFMLAAPAAKADNQSFLAAMDQLGFTSKNGPDGLLTTGKAACRLLAPSAGLMFGRHPNTVAEIVWADNPGLERNEAAQVVNAAIDNLCPGVNIYGYAST